MKNNSGSKGADNIFAQAKQAEGKSQWAAASALYDKAADRLEHSIYHPSNDSDIHSASAVLYFRAKINCMNNLFKQEMDESDEFDITMAIDQIKIIQNEKEKILTLYPHLLHRCHSIESSFLKKLEQWLASNGLEDESNKIFLHNQQVTTRFLKQNSAYKFKNHIYGEAISTGVRYVFRTFFYRMYLGYGINFKNLLISALGIIIFFGFVYWKFHSLSGYPTSTEYPDSIWEALFASILTFISMGFDHLAPKDNLWGHFVVSVEGILGFITFGGIIAYIWRRMNR